MIKILLFILAFVVLVVVGVFLYAYIQAKRETAQLTNPEDWLEYYTVDSTGKTWHRVRAPKTSGLDVPLFAGEYNKSTTAGGGEKRPGEYTEIKKPL